MKIYIFADLEGISGISGAVYLYGEHKSAGIELYVEEINNCIDACFQAGATEVIVRDGHSLGENLPSNKIDKRAGIVQGVVNGVRFPEIEGSDGMILLGYHAMAGTKGAILEHSYSSKNYQNIYLNGEKVGEIGIDAIIAGEHNVPILLVTGDDKACLEAEEWIDNIETCCVKKGFECNAAYCYPKENVKKALYNNVKKVISNINQAKISLCKKPCTLTIEYTNRNMTPKIGYIEVDSRTIQRSGNNLEEMLLS